MLEISSSDTSPDPIPARKAAPKAVDSIVLEHKTSNWITFESNWLKKRLFDNPPSILNSSTLSPSPSSEEIISFV